MIKRYLDDYETIRACYENNTGFKRYVDELTLDYNLEFLNEILDNANLNGFFELKM